VPLLGVSTNDHRQAAILWMVMLLDSGVEGVHVDVHDASASGHGPSARPEILDSLLK
jgi:hypothetical protein